MKLIAYRWEQLCLYHSSVGGYVRAVRAKCKVERAHALEMLAEWPSLSEKKRRWREHLEFLKYSWGRTGPAFTGPKSTLPTFMGGTESALGKEWYVLMPRLPTRKEIAARVEDFNKEQIARVAAR